MLTKLHQAVTCPCLASTWMGDTQEYQLVVDLPVQSRICKQITIPILLQM
jgi:hypothetical protein